MKILKSFPQLEIHANPREITQDIESFSEIKIKSSNFCQESIPLGLKFSGSAVMGEDYLVYYLDSDGNRQFLSYRSLTTDDFLIQTNIFNNNPILVLYVYPINYNTSTEKTIEIHILNEPRIFYTKVCCAQIRLKRSKNVLLNSGTLTHQTIAQGEGFSEQNEFDSGGVYIDISDTTYPVLDLESPTIEFTQTLLLIPEGETDFITLVRTGDDLSQNSVVKLHIGNIDTNPLIDYVTSAELYSTFYAYETSKEIKIKSILDAITEPTESFIITISPVINSSIGTNSSVEVFI